MKVVGRAPVPQPVSEPVCIACNRPARVVRGRLESQTVPGIGGREWLCSDPVDCRRHWPAEVPV